MKPSSDAAQSRDGTTPFFDYLATGFASWLIPGAGHFMLGHRVRGAILAVSLLGLFWYGERVLSNDLAVSRQVSPIFFCLQLGNGASALVAQNRWGSPRVRMSPDEPDRELPAGYHLGVLFTTISGLLNLLAVIHVMDPRTWVAARSSDGTSDESHSGKETSSTKDSSGQASAS